MDAYTEARGLAPRELKLQVVVSLLVWVLGIELRPTVRTIHTLNCRAVSSALNAFSINV